jgi:type II secretory pathway component GspD/PulD (secretin)
LPPSSLPFQTGLPAQHYGNTVAQPPPTNPDGATGFMPNPNTKLLKGQTMEHLLMDLIKNTVAQNSWSDVGGPAAIQYYPLGMALIVNQTLEVQEEVAALLQALRRLQDLEVAIEMRLVSVSEAFFERMGLDFDINIRTPHSRHEAQLLSGQFTPFGNINRNLGVRDVVSGMTPAGTLTPDLNIPLKSSSYNFSIPPFGGYPGTIGDAGGISLGLAFLNDIQVFMFLEAAQGDRRTNVMQAPKITLFNGQVSTMTVADNQFFLTDVQLGVPTPPFAGNQLFFIPNQQPYPLGVNLTVSAVVSADRRFVRVNLTPSLTNLASTTVPLFPVSIIVPQFFDGPGNNSSTNTQPQVFQMFFQQPAFTTITMSTTVNVPDGGTVLLGGLKTMSEARNEFGPPILSKIPYVNRLFRNIAYGRESQSLMIMVTPRIIINEEEEQILFGQIQIPRP